MKTLMTVLFFLILFNVKSQVVDSTKKYEYQYKKDLYQYEKNKMVWGVIGSTAMIVSGGVGYYRYGQNDYLYYSGLSLGFNVYSVIKLVYLKRELKRMEYERN